MVGLSGCWFEWQDYPDAGLNDSITRTAVGMAGLPGWRLEWQDYPDGGWNGRIIRMAVGMAGLPGWQLEWQKTTKLNNFNSNQRSC